MRFATLSFCAIVLLSSHAFADDEVHPTTDATARPDNMQTVGDKVDYGFDIRLRKVYLPSALLGLFVDRAEGGAESTGIGADFVRRRGDLELQFGVEYEAVNVKEGVYINKGDSIANGDTIDYILSPETGHGPAFHWLTFEFTFINHARINKYLAVRYGGGAGLGVLMGSVVRYDTQCAGGSSNSNVYPGCKPSQYGGGGTTVMDNSGAPETTPVAYNLPPIFPVVNAIIGLQIRPVDKVVINIEGGIRTLPFIGLSAGYFF